MSPQEISFPMGAVDRSLGIKELFRKFAKKTAELAGTPWAFMLAVLVLAVWACTGPIFGFAATTQNNNTQAVGATTATGTTSLGGSTVNGTSVAGTNSTSSGAGFSLGFGASAGTSSGQGVSGAGSTAFGFSGIGVNLP